MSDKPFSIKATIFWAYLDRENGLSGKYQADYGQLSDAAVEHLEELGVSVKDKGDDRGKFITSTSQYPIYAYDKDGERITDPVGNGSKAIVTGKTYNWKFKNKEGASFNTIKLTITDLEVYEAVPEDMSEALEAAL